MRKCEEPSCDRAGGDRQRGNRTIRRERRSADREHLGEEAMSDDLKPLEQAEPPKRAVVTEIVILRCMCGTIPCPCGRQMHVDHYKAETQCTSCGRFLTGPLRSET